MAGAVSGVAGICRRLARVRLVVCCLALAGALGTGTACSPRVQSFGPEFAAPRLDDAAFITRDGRRLPFSVWQPVGTPRAVVVALHGFNMYRNYFDRVGPWLAEHGIATYAYDQRGFGGSPERGIWGGRQAMAADVSDFIALVRQREPGRPLHLLGVSMGGAVALVALAGDDPPAVDSTILVAPAVWGGQAMHPAARISLWLAAHTMPWNLANGNGLGVRATDNIETLRRFGRDPLVIKDTRIDAVYGVTELMGAAYRTAARQPGPVLMLYGEHDQIVPPAPVEAVARALTVPHRLAVYPDGWHMLLHDLQAEAVWRDIAAWIAEPGRPLPSGADRAVAARTGG